MGGERRRAQRAAPAWPRAARSACLAPRSGKEGPAQRRRPSAGAEECRGGSACLLACHRSQRGGGRRAAARASRRRPWRLSSKQAAQGSASCLLSAQPAAARLRRAPHALARSAGRTLTAPAACSAQTRSSVASSPSYTPTASTARSPVRRASHHRRLRARAAALALAPLLCGAYALTRRASPSAPPSHRPQAIDLS